MRKNITKIGVCFVGFLLLFFYTSCNKSYQEQQVDSSYNDTSVLIKNPKKILYIIVDGARGSVVRNLKLPTINALASTSIYSWYSLSGFEKNDTSVQASWANMMTGNLSSLTKVSTTFDTSNLTTYPSFVKRVEAVGKSVASYSTSSDFENHLTNDAEIHKSYGNDALTANALIDAAATINSDVIIGEFNGVYQQGLKTSFDSGDVNYANSIRSIDTYIGNIVSTIKKRANYNSERWVFIVSSTANLSKQSISVNDQSAYGDPKLNTFTIISNDNFKESYVDKPASTKGSVPYVTTALRLRGDFGTRNNDGNRVLVTDSKSLFNCPPGKSLTVEAKIKINPKNTGSYSYTSPPFLSKVYMRYSNYSGWSFYRDGNSIAFWIGTGATSGQVNTGSITDNKWHTITGKILWSSTAVYIYIYLDGVYVTYKIITVTPSSTMINNTYPLVIGYWPFNVYSNNEIDCYIKDVRLWNIGLTTAQIATYSCYPTENLPTDLSYKSNLIGDYRIQITDSTSVKDFSVNNQNGIYDIAPAGSMQWTSFNEISNAICPPMDDNYYNGGIKSQDIPYFIYTWLGVRIDPSWNLTGQYWEPSLNY